jgi:hypothetical protein
MSQTPKEDAMPVLGYASRTSVQPGETIDFHLCGDPVTSVALRVQRFSSAPTSAVVTPSILLIHQKHPPNGWEGFDWPVTTRFTVPPDWPDGLYVLRANDYDVTSFVVKSANPGVHSKILLQVCVNTPQAYNNAGGKSLYGYNSDGQGGLDERRARRVSFDRPGSEIDYERKFIQWAEAEGIALDYCTSLDLHEDGLRLNHYDLLLSIGHDEYWSKEMRDHVEAYIRNGGNVAFFTGNTCYRQVRFEGAHNRTMVFYKYAGDDPLKDDNDRVTVAFAEPPVNRPPNIMLGVGFTQGSEFAPLGSAFTIRFPQHWVFEDVDVPTFGAQTDILSYETDGAGIEEEDEGYVRVTGEEGTPLNYTVLALADLRSSVHKPGWATMGIYTRNGTVFNAATINWVNALVGPAADPTVKQITKNVVTRLKTRRTWDWETIGRAPDGCALTGLEGRLYLATSDSGLWRRYPVGADVPWKRIGAAPDVKALAGAGGKLFAVMSDNRIAWRRAGEQAEDWTPIGDGPAGGLCGLAAASGMLYTVDAAGTLMTCPISTGRLDWRPVWSEAAPFFEEQNPRIQTLTTYSDILFAATTDGRLVRTDRDFIFESTAWLDVLAAPNAVGLAVIDNMLFMATADGQLRWLDVFGLRLP